MREGELAAAVLGRLDIDFHLVADLQIGIVAELGNGHDALALVADVDDDFPLADARDGSLDHFADGYVREGLVISLGNLLPGLVVHAQVVFIRVPVELLVGYFFHFFHVGMCCDSIAR